MHPSRMSVLLMERRQESRVAVNRPGMLLFGGSKVACIIDDLSDGGAGVTLLNTGPASLPRELALMLEGESCPRPCQIVWSRSERLGLKFE